MMFGYIVSGREVVSLSLASNQTGFFFLAVSDAKKKPSK